MRTHTLLLALAAPALATPLLDAQSWTQQNPLNKPGPRRAGAMAFDVMGNRVIINGGTIASPGQIINETWTFNGANWTQLSPTNPGPARWGHQIVRDTMNNRLVTFGGRSPTINGLSNDTWSWNGSNWSALTPMVSPTPRFRYGMVFDNRRNVVVLFGGRTATGNTNQTWEFDGINWAQITTANAPSPREDMVMAFDEATASTVVFGGLDNDTATLLGDTWEYRGIDWVEAAPASSPSPRYRAAGVYDSERQRVVVYGGYDGTAFRTDTFEYSGSDWLPVAVGAASANSTEMYYAYDPARDRFVTFGGVGSVFSDDHWEFDGASTAFFGSFGQGCPHSGGISTISGTAPVLNQQFDLEVLDVPAGVLAVVVTQGFSATVSNLGPLPFDLTPFGLVGCFLEVGDVATLAVLPDLNNEYKFGFMVPNDPSLVNLNYYVQAFVPDNLSPNSIGGLSRPGRGTFGN